MVLKCYNKDRVLLRKRFVGVVFLFSLGIGAGVLLKAQENKDIPQATPAENQKTSQLSIKEVNAHRLTGWAPFEVPAGGKVFFTSLGEMIAVIEGEDKKVLLKRYDGKEWSDTDAISILQRGGGALSLPLGMGIGPTGAIYRRGDGANGEKRSMLHSSLNGSPFEPLSPGLGFQMLGGFIMKNNKLYVGISWDGYGIPVFVSEDGRTFKRTSPKEKLLHQSKPGAAYAFKIHPLTGDFYTTSEGDGVWISSDDGKTWRRHDVPAASGGNMFDIDFNSAGDVFIASSGGGPNDINGVYRYKDGKWMHTLKGRFLDRGVYAVCAKCNTGAVYAGAMTGVYQSSDNGDTWDPDPINTGIRRFEKERDGAIVMSTLKINSLDVGPGGYLYASVFGTGLHRSTTPVINQPPTITTAPWAEPKNVNLSKLTTVDVVASDLDPVPLNYTWSKSSGPGRATFTPKGNSPSAAEVTFSTPGLYTLGITISDGQLSTSGDLKVEVRPANGPGPEVAFRATQLNGSETDPKPNLEVFLKSPSTKEVSVEYEVVGGTAKAGSDYELVNGKLTFPPGKTSMTIPLIITNDQTDETDETVEVLLSSATEAHLGFDAMATYTITDDDPPPAIAFETASSSGDELVKAANLKVLLDKPSGQEVTIDYAVTGGTATGDGVDYMLHGGKLTFKPGETTQAIPLAIVLDALKEEDETVIVTLSNPVLAVLGAHKEHTFTIKDVAVPAVAFSQETSQGSEATTPANLTVTLSAPSARSITVDYAVNGGTATSEGEDYTLAPGTLIFNPGETSKIISIAITNDKMDEDDEVLKVALSNPTNAILGKAKIHSYTIIDDDPLPKVSFQTATSGGKDAKVIIVIDVPTGKVANVSCNPTGGTAESGVDYKVFSNINFSGANEKKTRLELSIQRTARSGKTIELTLVNPRQCEIGEIKKHIFTIQ